jgi:thiopeptide-type bacteriocin biosynthesis protein
VDGCRENAMSAEERSGMGAWQSLHLFIAGGLFGSDGDRLITEVVAPATCRLQATGAVDGFFFIRYVEKGPHVRWRIRCAPSMSKLMIEAELSRTLAGEVGTRPDLARYEWIDYEPEVVRYGGAVGVRIAESFFERSSEAVIQVLRSRDLASPAKRRAMAMLSMLTIAAPFFAELPDLQTFLQRYSADRMSVYGGGSDVRAELRLQVEAATERQRDRYRLAVAKSRAALTDGEPPVAELKALLAGARTAKQQLTSAVRDGLIETVNGRPASFGAAAMYLLPSYLHMTANRFGVSNADESFVAHGVADALSRCGDIESAASQIVGAATAQECAEAHAKLHEAQ